MSRRLGDLVEITGGGTPSRRVPEYWCGNVPWATVKDFRDATLATTMESITLDGLQNSAANLITAGSIIVPTRMAVGKVAINTVDLAINQDLKALRIRDESTIDVNFLFRFLSSQSEYLESRSKGATVKGITLDVLREMQIPLPPLKEQKRIAAILDKADAIRRKRQQAIELTAKLLRSIFIEMFGDPITNPKNFVRRQLDEFYVDHKNGTKCGPFGSALRKNEYTLTGSPVWAMDNISVSGEFVGSPNLWIGEQKYRALASYSTNNGDVIVSRAGTVGKMCVVETSYNHSIISTNLIRIRFGEELSPYFFVALMNYCRGRVGRLRTGPDGSFTHMNTGILDGLVFPYPPIELQKEFENRRIRIREHEAELKRALVQKESLFAALSQRAFHGELRKSKVA